MDNSCLNLNEEKTEVTMVCLQSKWDALLEKLGHPTHKSGCYLRLLLKLFLPSLIQKCDLY